MGINKSVGTAIAGGAAIAFFPKILMLVLSWILFDGIVQNFLYKILTLKDNIDVIFEGITW